jgi:hypothetical protein
MTQSNGDSTDTPEGEVKGCLQLVRGGMWKPGREVQ